MKKVLFAFPVIAATCLVLFATSVATAIPKTARAQSSAPVISHLSPASGPVGTQVTVIGTGLVNTSLENTITFSQGGAVVTSLTSTITDTTLSFIVPSTISIPSPTGSICGYTNGMPGSSIPCYTNVPMPPGVYQVAVTNYNLNGTSNTVTFTVTQATPTASHPAGTNVISGQQVYMIQFGGCGGIAPSLGMNNCAPDLLKAYPSAAVFLSYPQNSWSNVVQANSDDLALSKGSLMTFAPGTLVNDNGTIYVMSGNSPSVQSPDVHAKHGIPNAATFLSLGYKWGNVINGDTSFMQAGNIASSEDAHLPGTLIDDKGTIYYITYYGKIGIVSMDEFTSKGFNLKDVVPANSQDRALQKDPYGWIGPLPESI